MTTLTDWQAEKNIAHLTYDVKNSIKEALIEAMATGGFGHIRIDQYGTAVHIPMENFIKILRALEVTK